MSRRLSTGGRLIDRDLPLDFTFNGKTMQGFAGDTLASALLAGGQRLVGRSFKYHRPRGVLASGPEEPNALVNLGAGRKAEPNQRATTQELFDGLTATSQNHWPSLEFDIGAVNANLSQFLPAGFYYKMFLWPRAFWKHVYEPFIRQSAGLGPAPMARDADTYEHFHTHTDVLIAGGGVAGLQAALSAGQAGARVLLMEQSAHWGGRSPVDGGEIDGKPADAWINDALEVLEAMENVEMRSRTQVTGIYDHGYVLANERLTDHEPAPEGPRHRMWKIRAGHVVTATGAIERPLSFAGNDLPGVMLASAVRDYVENYAVNLGDRAIVVTNNDDAYRTALSLHDAGIKVRAIVDARPEATGDLPQKAREAGIRIETGSAIYKIIGTSKVDGVQLCGQQGEAGVTEELATDIVAMSGGWSPVVHLWSHCGGKLNWNEEEAFFAPDPDRAPTGHDGSPFVSAAGAAAGHLRLADALRDAGPKGHAAANGQGDAPAAPIVDAPNEEPMLPVWVMPERAGPKLRQKMWLDFQNDVKVSDVQLAQREGYESVEHTKRYTTLGMATDQGKTSNINGLAILSQARGKSIPEVGTTTFRPPYTPLTLGAIAGEARGALFQPIRRTPMHDWHEARGAHWEPVGHWRRPYAFPEEGESVHDAVSREVKTTREAVGLLDASTLGKILVKGPDAGRFLDMIYTNMMSTLPVGRCRYGLMCSENGFLMDDGVVARISDDAWLCHTTTGGADRIHAHMEEWLQTEWWDWTVYTANLTEQYAQIAVVGPDARNVLETIGDVDLSKEALPFMHWTDAKLGAFDARIFRISFSGELSYEVAIPASQGLELWEALMKAGTPFGITPYGTEALHVMRAEKGFIMIGDETDGTVIPQDLGLNWAISKKKEDFIGKRAQERTHMTDPRRWKLVGLETLDGSVLPEGAYALGEGRNANGQRNVQGRVTSTYYSPTLGRGIAMGLVLNGPDRMGEEMMFSNVSGDPVKAKIVSPVFYDPEGARQDV